MTDGETNQRTRWSTTRVFTDRNWQITVRDSKGVRRHDMATDG
jgi:hypothetical protein